MPSGEAFDDGQVREIARAVQQSSQETGLHFSVYVGAPQGEPRDYAERLLGALGTHAPLGVLVFLAPEQRRLEIVTGPDAARRVPDRGAALAALSMRTAFVGGDLVGGLVTGLRMMAETAGQVRAIEAGTEVAATER